MTEVQFKLKRIARLLELYGRCLGFIADHDEIGLATSMSEIEVVERATYTEKGNTDDRTIRINRNHET